MDIKLMIQSHVRMSSGLQIIFKMILKLISILV